jgi:hypothetical protein
VASGPETSRDLTRIRATSRAHWVAESDARLSRAEPAGRRQREPRWAGAARVGEAGWAVESRCAGAASANAAERGRARLSRAERTGCAAASRAGR